jgi:orotidine-5'-phosphate decarboxylase
MQKVGSICIWTFLTPGIREQKDDDKNLGRRYRNRQGPGSFSQRVRGIDEATTKQQKLPVGVILEGAKETIFCQTREKIKWVGYSMLEQILSLV